jgi:hypothetical protein
MTQPSIHISEQHSVLTDVVSTTLVSVVIVLAGLLALAPYAAAIA